MVDSSDNPQTDEPVRRLRGRPRRNCSNDERINARRERNRKAQAGYRIRQQAAQETRRQYVDGLKKSLHEVISAFLEFTNDVVQSDLAQRDLALMNNLRQSTQRILSLAEETSESTPEPSTTEDALGEVPTLEALPSCDLGSGMSEVVVHEGAFPSNVSQNGSDTTTDSHTGLLNALVWPLMHEPRGQSCNLRVPTCLHNSVSQGGPRPRLDNPLSLQITYLAIEKAYHLLSAATGPPNDTVLRVFGHVLQYRTRQAILDHLHWHLGAGSTQIDALATACTGARAGDPRFRGDYYPRDERYYDANTIARFLRERILGDASDETLDVMVQTTSTGNLNDAEKAAMLQQGPNLQQVPGSGAHGVYNEVWVSKPTPTIQVSKSRLLHNVAAMAICLGFGPGFTKADFEHAILSSMIEGPRRENDLFFMEH